MLVRLIIGAVLLGFSIFASAESPWEFRIGTVTIDPHETAGDISLLTAGSKAGVDSDTEPTIMINYAVTKAFRLATFIGPGFSHGLYGVGTIKSLGKVATASYDVPTLMFQYYFDQMYGFEPYLGVGVSYAQFRDEKATSSLNNALGQTSLDVGSIWASDAQVGLRYHIDKWILDASVVRTNFEPTTARLNTAGVIRSEKIDLDPYAYLFSVGYAF